MHGLGAELAHLDRFGEGDGVEQLGAGNDARVGGHQAIHIRPDPTFLGLERGTDDAACVVAPAAPQGGRHAMLRGGDESGDDDGLAPIQVRLEIRPELVQRQVHQRLGLAEVVVGDDAGFLAGEALATKRGGHEHC